MDKNKKYSLAAVVVLIILSWAALLYSGSKKVFPHKVHMENDMTCASCHTGVEKSTRAGDNNLPGGKSCIDCHEKTIFSAYEPAGSKPENKIAFNHEIHITQDMKCLKCHSGIEKKDFVPGSAFPGMKLCFGCHNNKDTEKKCGLCHISKVQFPHKTHMAQKFSCEDCHTSINESTKNGRGKDIPSKNSCDDCHEAEEKYAKVTLFPYSQSYKMNHKLHLQNMGLSCKDCHKAFYEKNKIKESEIVVHYAYCLDCHDNQTAPQHCMLCHINPMRPDTHMGDCEKRHKIQADMNIKECLACHTEQGFCNYCHRGVKKPINSHNPNFVLTHKYESRTTLKNCQACHSERYCRNCHTTSGVTKKSKKYKKQHPGGWLDANSPNFHKRKARLRLTSCTSCHTRNDCSYCHFKRKR